MTTIESLDTLGEKLFNITENSIVFKETNKYLTSSGFYYEVSVTYCEDEVETYADNIYEKLIKSCSLGKNDYLSIIRNYPLNLINGNTNSIVNRVLLDFYGN